MKQFTSAQIDAAIKKRYGADAKRDRTTNSGDIMVDHGGSYRVFKERDLITSLKQCEFDQELAARPRLSDAEKQEIHTQKFGNVQVSDFHSNMQAIKDKAKAANDAHKASIAKGLDNG